MLVALVLTLEPTVTATLPAFLGQAVHAWFLEEVQRESRELPHALHDGETSRPFTVSSLWSPSSRPPRDTLHLSTGQTCYLRITSVDAALSQCLVEALAPRWPNATVHLCGVPFRVRGVAGSEAEHPRAARVSYGALVAHAMHAPPHRDATFQFLSPTVFRRAPLPDTPSGDGSYNLPFPLPELVFGGLHTAWNTFAPCPIPEDVQGFARDCIVVSRYRLQTQLVEFSGGRRGRVGGFVGTCRFSIRSPDAAWRRRVALLAALAPFAGIGWRTTMGLGQTRPVDASTG